MLVQEEEPQGPEQIEQRKMNYFLIQSVAKKA